MSSGRLDRSSVVPEGTATAESTMVEHDFCDLLANDAPLLPEKVQLVALFTRAASGAGVITGAGSATGDAITELARMVRNNDQYRVAIFGICNQPRNSEEYARIDWDLTIILWRIVAKSLLGRTTFIYKFRRQSRPDFQHLLCQIS